MKRTWHKRMCTVLLILPLALQVNVFSVKAEENAWDIADTVGVESGKSGDLDWSINESGLLTISGNGDYACEYSIPGDAEKISAPIWCRYSDKITKVTVSVTNITNTSNMFYRCGNIEEIDLSGLDTSNVTDMSNMFNNCNSLTELNLTKINTNHVTNMRGLFSGCSKLKSLDVSGFRTGNVTDMVDMFNNCHSLQKLDVSNFDTRNVTNMMHMFSGCYQVTDLDLSNFDTRNVVNMMSMFSTNYNLVNLNLSSFGTGKVTDMTFMFAGCSGLTSLDLSVFDMKSVTKAENMFLSCSGMSKLKMPANIKCNIDLPGEKKYQSETSNYVYQVYGTWYDETGKMHTQMEKNLSSPMIYGKNFIPTPDTPKPDTPKPSDPKPAEPVGTKVATYGNDVFYQGDDGKLRCYENGRLVTNEFKFDGAFTYYMQADGTPMKDRLTYHPDGEHIIYLDTEGHEVFTNFQFCPSVGYTCYFDSQGYLYKDQITFVGDKVYYLNANGAMEQNGWFQFANGMDYGCANSNGALVTTGFSYDPYGRVVFYHWNGMVARGLISDGAYYYSMDTGDGHYLGQFPVQ